MKKIAKISFLVLSVVFLLTVSYLGSFAEEKVIKFARPEDIEFLDPYGPTKALSTMVWYMIYDRLLILDPNTESGFAPELATEWEISPDAKEYTFKLREGVKFHNGEPFNAETVKGSMERFIKEPTLGSAPQWVSLEEVEIIDDYTVKMKFKEPNVVCLNNLAYTPMIPVKAFAEKGTALFDNPIGTGAFIWDHWKRGQELVVKKNPDYWGKPAYVDKFVFLPLIESSTRLAAILTGEIDIADLMNVDDIPTVKSSPNVEVQEKLGWIQIVIALKTDTAPMTDIKFRQAIDLAIDREGIVNNILKGGRVSNGYMMEGVFGLDESAVPVKRDVEKAKQLVKESIYDGRVLTVMIPLGWYPFERVIGEAVQAQFKEVGINVALEILDAATFSEKRAAGNYDMFFNNNVAYTGDLAYNMTREFFIDKNKMGNINPELKKLVEESNQEANVEKRKELMKEINQLIAYKDFGPIISICQHNIIYFMQKGLTGIRFFGDLRNDFRWAHYEE